MKYGFNFEENRTHKADSYDKVIMLIVFTFGLVMGMFAESILVSEDIKTIQQWKEYKEMK